MRWRRERGHDEAQGAAGFGRGGMKKGPSLRKALSDGMAMSPNLTRDLSLDASPQQDDTDETGAEKNQRGRLGHRGRA